MFSKMFQLFFDSFSISHVIVTCCDNNKKVFNCNLVKSELWQRYSDFRKCSVF